MQLTRRTVGLVAVLVLALAAGGAVYVRYRVNKAAAECDMPALPEKPATPAPDLPDFAAGEACGPGDGAKGAATASAGDVAAAAGTKR